MAVAGFQHRTQARSHQLQLRASRHQAQAQRRWSLLLRRQPQRLRLRQPLWSPQPRPPHLVLLQRRHRDQRLPRLRVQPPRLAQPHLQPRGQPRAQPLRLLRWFAHRLAQARRQVQVLRQRRLLRLPRPQPLNLHQRRLLSRLRRQSHLFSQRLVLPLRLSQLRCQTQVSLLRT